MRGLSALLALIPGALPAPGHNQPQVQCRAANVLAAGRDAAEADGAFSVLSYNILLPAFAQEYPGVDPAVLAWAGRRERICEHLVACDADVVALQEVDVSSFREDFAVVLDTCGYGASVQLPDRGRPYGNVLLYRRQRFTLEAEESRSRVQIAVLREDSRRLYCASVHLTRGAGEQHTRLLQLKSLFRRLNGFRARLVTIPAELEGALISGDFNSDRHSEVFRLLRDSGLKRFPSVRRRANKTPIAASKPYATGFLALRDVYRAVPPAWGPYEATHRNGLPLDYIWASPNLEVLMTMPCARERAHDEELFGGHRLESPTAPLHRRPLPIPSQLYPSDHLAIGCALRWQRSEQGEAGR